MKRLLLALVLLLSVHPSEAAIAYVRQNGSVFETVGGGTNSHVMTITPPSAGNFAVIVCYAKADRTNWTTTVTEANVTWTQHLEQDFPSQVQAIAIWYAQGIGIGSSAGSTVTIGTATNLIVECVMHEYSGMLTSGVADSEIGTFSQASGTTAKPCTSGTTCPAAGTQDQANELIIGAIGIRTASSCGAASGYTERYDHQSGGAVGDNTLCVEERIVSVAEEAYFTLTIPNNTQNQNCGGIARFKGVASASYGALVVD